MKEYYIHELNCRMRYYDFPGNDIPILFLHGLGCAGSFDYPQVAAQRELEGHRRILVDLLGAGYSDKPENFEIRPQGCPSRSAVQQALNFIKSGQKPRNYAVSGVFPFQMV